MDNQNNNQSNSKLLRIWRAITKNEGNIGIIKEAINTLKKSKEVNSKHYEEIFTRLRNLESSDGKYETEINNCKETIKEIKEDIDEVNGKMERSFNRITWLILGTLLTVILAAVLDKVF